MSLTLPPTVPDPRLLSAEEFEIAVAAYLSWISTNTTEMNALLPNIDAKYAVIASATGISASIPAHVVTLLSSENISEFNKAQEIFALTNSAYTLTNTTAFQKLLNVSTNGAVTVTADTSYLFECAFELTSTGISTQTLGFSLIGSGTATLVSAAWHASGFFGIQTTPNAMNGIHSVSVAENGPIITAGTGQCNALIKGVFRVNAAGTMIPSIKFNNSATPSVQPNAVFRAVPIGNKTVTASGTWS